MKNLIFNLHGGNRTIDFTGCVLLDTSPASYFRIYFHPSFIYFFDVSPFCDKMSLIDDDPSSALRPMLRGVCVCAALHGLSLRRRELSLYTARVTARAVSSSFPLSKLFQFPYLLLRRIPPSELLMPSKSLVVYSTFFELLMKLSCGDVADAINFSLGDNDDELLLIFLPFLFSWGAVWWFEFIYFFPIGEFSIKFIWQSCTESTGCRRNSNDVFNSNGRCHGNLLVLHLFDTFFFLLFRGVNPQRSNDFHLDSESV